MINDHKPTAESNNNNNNNSKYNNNNNYDFADDDEYRKIRNTRTLVKDFDRDYYKPIRTDSGFAGRNNNYIEYTSKRDRYEH